METNALPGTKKKRVASMFAPWVNTEMFRLAGDLDVLATSFDSADPFPDDIEILLAMPANLHSGETTDARPAGWPFGLRWVHLPSSGLDGYPDWMLGEVIVTRTPHISGVALAEYALGAILTVAKNLPDLWINSANQWQRHWVPTVAGSSLGIVGFGDIGRELAARAQAFGMEISVLRRSALPLPIGIRRAADIAELLATSDHLVLAAPAADDTRHMISDKSLAHAKPGLHLINLARGSLVDNVALLAALDDGRVGHATLDVTDPEPLPSGHPFYTHPRVRISPHTAAATHDMMEKLGRYFIENVARYYRGDPLEGLVAY